MIFAFESPCSLCSWISSQTFQTVSIRSRHIQKQDHLLPIRDVLQVEGAPEIFDDSSYSGMDSGGVTALLEAHFLANSIHINSCFKMFSEFSW